MRRYADARPTVKGKLMRWLTRLFKPKIRFEIRARQCAALQHWQDDYLELVWRAKVQQRIERDRALKLLEDRESPDSQSS